MDRRTLSGHGAARSARLVLSAMMSLLLPASCSESSAAVQRFTERCNSGEARACFALGNVYADGQLVERDMVAAQRATQRALALSQQGCNERRQMDACHLLAARLFVGTDGGVQRDLPRAKRLFQRACNGGSARSCNMLRLIDRHGEEALLEGSRSLFGVEEP